eukprot:TRINITY_DN2521_c2_g1_i1.p1 TRINITY_DN2521_c2_g1~~TRINITY_DN2521_c2_g1_i1.p1  ORF type:complete len:627 (+),score=125.72 TRINITY_DN2521_c2_g1_i1:71-1882(+)
MAEGEPVPPPYGMHAKRGCTDILFLLLLLCAVVGYVVVAVIAWDNGNPWRLLYGTDYLGNVCAKTGSKNAPRLPNVTDWGERDVLWYPFDVDDITYTDNAVKMGVCLQKCPGMDDIVTVYPDPSNTTQNMPSSFTVAYTSSLKFRRCIPDSNNSAALHRLADIIDISDYVFEGIAEVRAAEDTIWYSLAVALGLSAAWLILVYFFALPMLFVSILLIIAGFAVGGYLLNDHADDLKNDDNSDYKWVRAAGWVLWIMGGLFTLLCVFMNGKIRKGARVAKEGSAMLLTIPTVLFIPFIFVVFLVGWAAMAVLTLLNIQTMESTSTGAFNWTDSEIQGFIREVPVDKGYFHAYNIIFFVWFSLFLIDTEYLCTAMTASFWYFSNPDGVRKSPPTCSPFIALATTMKHVGTTAFGSAIITICKVIRWVLLRVENRLKNVSSESVKCCFKIAQCCLCCLEKCLKVLSEKAYVMTAIEGTNFCSSARRAISLIVTNFASVAIVEIITAFMTFIGKLLIVCATGVFAYFCLEEWDVSPNVESFWVPLIVICILAYLISGVFIHIFSTVVDSIMLCHCVDKEANNTPVYGNNRTRQIASDCSKHGKYVAY